MQKLAGNLCPSPGFRTMLIMTLMVLVRLLVQPSDGRAFPARRIPGHHRHHAAAGAAHKRSSRDHRQDRRGRQHHQRDVTNCGRPPPKRFSLVFVTFRAGA